MAYKGRESSMSLGKDTNQVRLPGRGPAVVQSLEVNSSTICLCREPKFNYSHGPGKSRKRVETVDKQEDVVGMEEYLVDSFKSWLHNLLAV